MAYELRHWEPLPKDLSDPGVRQHSPPQPINENRAKKFNLAKMNESQAENLD